MELLIVEDSLPDRQLLIYLLEDKFQQEASFREADRLETALAYLKQREFDCVILDLNLPDSSGKETFEKLYSAFPHIPYVILTNTRDRELALQLVKAGASDYIAKDFTSEEELFERIKLAAAKAKTSIRVVEESAVSVKQLEKARQALVSAHKSGQYKAVQETTLEATNAIMDLTQRVFAELQRVSSEQARVSSQMEIVSDTVRGLDREVLRGHSDRPSMRSQLELLAYKHEDLARRVQGLESDTETLNSEVTQKVQALKEDQLTRTIKQVQEKAGKEDVARQDRAKLIVGLAGVVVTLIGVVLTYLAATQEPTPPAKHSSTATVTATSVTTR